VWCSFVTASSPHRLHLVHLARTYLRSLAAENWELGTGSWELQPPPIPVTINPTLLPCYPWCRSTYTWHPCPPSQTHSLHPLQPRVHYPASPTRHNATQRIELNFHLVIHYLPIASSCTNIRCRLTQSFDILRQQSEGRTTANMISRGTAVAFVFLFCIVFLASPAVRPLLLLTSEYLPNLCTACIRGWKHPHHRQSRRPKLPPW